MEAFTNNVTDTALIFEGGGMRNSYSSAVVNVLLEEGFYFDSVYGVSAGGSNALNYLSRDKERSRCTFVENTDDLPFRKAVMWLLQKGLFGSHAARDNRANPQMPFDFERFQANPAQLTIESINRDTGESVYWTRKDFPTEKALMERLRATLSYPLIMAPVKLDDGTGNVYYDGGPGQGGDIMLPRAKLDGYEKYFVVCTQPKGFRKQLKNPWAYDLFFWRKPAMRNAFQTWSARYNRQLDNLDRLTAEGRAYVFYANHQSVTNRELNTELLRQNYHLGYEQARSEVDAWAKFLGL